MHRTHTSKDINLNLVGKDIEIAGFVHEIRKLGGMIFIVLRDFYGFTQSIVTPDSVEALEIAKNIRTEFVIKISGTVQKRQAGQENMDWTSGEVELIVKSIEILNKAEVLPFEVSKDDKMNLPSEELRLKYRYLDIRRKGLQKNLKFISDVMRFTHNYFQDHDFVEVKTPILANSSPEGARDFLVPSRVHKGKCFALPQAPQQFKQMLMVGGFDRYYQIAPCFRDEDPRADRLPGEFYQIDCEMAYVTQDDVLEYIEGFVVSVIDKLTDKKLLTSKPFRRLSYAEAMLKYGSDKPDIRFGMEIQDVSEVFVNTEFGIFKDTLANGGIVRCLVVPGIADKAKKYVEDTLTPQAKRGKTKGLAFGVVTGGKLDATFAKFLKDSEVSELLNKTGAKDGDTILFVAGSEEVVAKSLGHVRYFLGKDLKLYEEDTVGFVWVLDMPFFEWNDEFDKVDFGHNPFSSPQGGLEAFVSAGNDKEKLLAIKAWQYDLACNGYEILSGGIRNSNTESLKKAFEIVGYSEEEIKEKFGYMVEAYTYGAPPHGGFAIGLDRFVMILSDEEDVRSVCAFPKSTGYTDLMTGAPHMPTSQQLKELEMEFKNE